MSVELYPDHKAILHFQDSLKVYEIDFLDYLTEFLLHDEYAKRQFEIYVKPTLGHSAFDFIVLEPNQAIYSFQTPENLEQFQINQETFDYFMSQRLYTLSPAFQRRIQQTIFEKQQEKKEIVIKQLFYVYEESLLEEIYEEGFEDAILITSKDFKEDFSTLNDVFSVPQNSSVQLTDVETEEIKERINPNTNIEHYISKRKKSKKGSIQITIVNNIFQKICQEITKNMQKANLKQDRNLKGPMVLEILYY